MLSTSKAPPWMIGRKGWFEVDNPKLSPSGILRDGGKASSKTGFDFGLRDQLLHWPSWLFMPWLRSGRVSMMLIKFRPFWGKPTMSGITGCCSKYFGLLAGAMVVAYSVFYTTFYTGRAA